MQIKVTHNGLIFSDDFDAKKTWVDSLAQGVNDVCSGHEATYIFIVHEEGKIPSVNISCYDTGTVTSLLGSVFIRQCEEVEERDPLKVLKDLLKSRQDKQ